MHWPVNAEGEVFVDSTSLQPSVSLSACSVNQAEPHSLSTSLERLEALWKRIQEKATSELSFVDIINNLLDAIGIVFPSSTAAVLQLKGEERPLTIDHCQPEEARNAWLEEVQRMIVRGQLTLASQHGGVMLLSPYETQLHQTTIRALVIVPLASLQGVSWVVLVGASQVEVSSLDVKMFSMLARQIAFALECAYRESVLKREKAYLEEATRRQTSEIEHSTHTIVQLNQELEVELKKAFEVSDRLSLADRIRESLLATVSHELRTPLSAILGSLELFREEWNAQLPPEARQMIEICERNSSMLLSLISDLLDVASLQSSQPVLLKHPLDLATLVQETFERISPLARANGVHLEHAVAPGVEAYADSLRIQQVLLHLGSNAIKFRGKTNPYVRVSASIEGDRVILAVRDNGIGIASENLTHIFEPFAQGEDSYTSPTQGAGLGLSICQGIIKQHGGSIWVESELGKGSCFSFSLPLPPPVLPR
jgi:signal transduction histidine kinase